MKNVDLSKWYRPSVDQEEFNKLCKKSDWPKCTKLIEFVARCQFPDQAPRLITLN